MKVIGIIAAMDLEIKIIKDKMSIEHIMQFAGFKFIVGKYKELNLILTICGIGKVNAASCTQLLIDKFNVTEIINTGIAGSLNENVKLCDIVISDNVTYHDVRPEQMISCFPYKEYFNACDNLKSVAISAFISDSKKNYSYHIGRIVSGESFVSNDLHKKEIINSFAPLCVEMEGAAIGHVSNINNIPFIVIRCISDNADNNASINYDEFEVVAAINSANLVLEMLDILSVH